MHDNTHGALSWAAIMQAYHEVEADLTTDAERLAISQLGAALEVASLNATPMAEARNLVASLWATIDLAFDTLLPKLATQAERDAIISFHHGIETLSRPYDDEGYDDYYWKDYGAAPVGPLPDEFYRPGTSYVVLPPAGDTFAAVTASISEQRVDESDGVVCNHTTLEDFREDAEGWAHHWAGKLDTADAETLRAVTYVPDLPLTEAQFACVVQYYVNTQPGLRNPHQAVYEALCLNAHTATYAALDAAEKHFGVRVSSETWYDEYGNYNE